MTTRTAILMFGLLIAIAGCGGSSEPALAPSVAVIEVFEPVGGQFKVNAPVSGWKRTEESADMPDGGKLVSVTYLANDPRTKVVYVVSYNEFPPEAISVVGDKDEALDNAAVGLIAPYRARMEQNEAIKLGEAPGRKLRFDIPSNPSGAGPRKGLARVYLVGVRLWTITTLLPAGMATPPEVESFFESFTVTKPG